MHGLEGAAQVIAALLHGVCTVRTTNTVPGTAQVEGHFEMGHLDVQAETAAFLNATEPHPLWEGPAPLCLVEHYAGQVRRLRLVLTKQNCLSRGEQNQFSKAAGFCLAMQQMAVPIRIGSLSPTPVTLELGACFMRSAMLAVRASRSVALSATRLVEVMPPTRRGYTNLKPCTKSTFMMHGGVSRY